MAELYKVDSKRYPQLDGRPLEAINNLYLDANVGLEDQREQLDKLLGILWSIGTTLIADTNTEVTLTIPNDVIIDLALVGETAAQRMMTHRGQSGYSDAGKVYISMLRGNNEPDKLVITKIHSVRDPLTTARGIDGGVDAEVRERYTIFANNNLREKSLYMLTVEEARGPMHVQAGDMRFTSAATQIDPITNTPQVIGQFMCEKNPSAMSVNRVFGMILYGLTTGYVAPYMEKNK